MTAVIICDAGDHHFFVKQKHVAIATDLFNIKYLSSLSLKYRNSLNRYSQRGKTI